jgi:hypothetical protein
MKEQEIRKLPFDSSELPEDWIVVNDSSSEDPIFLVLPLWLFSKMKNGEWISEKDYSRYVSEVGDLQIDFQLKSKKK